MVAVRLALRAIGLIRGATSGVDARSLGQALGSSYMLIIAGGRGASFPRSPAA